MKKKILFFNWSVFINLTLGELLQLNLPDKIFERYVEQAEYSHYLELRKEEERELMSI
jgi:hypothetical protein